MRKASNRYCILTALLFCRFFAPAQGYQALHGSSYTGSTAVFNNPASAMSSIYPWELTLFSMQAKLSTDAFSIRHNALTLNDGYGTRFMHANLDASLLNFLYRIDSKKTFVFNLRARTYNHVNTLPFNYVNASVTSLNSFLIANRSTAFLEGATTHSGWLEGDFTYAKVLSENDNSQLSGGVTLQVMKGISGAFLKLTKVSYLEAKNATDTSYSFTNGTGSFGYSDNYDNTADPKAFVNNSKLSLGLSLGIEYLVFASDESTGNRSIDYDWKIGVSLMDLGGNSFRASPYSGQYSDPKASVSDAQLNDKFTGAANMRDLRDSMNTIFNTASTITNSFSITNPTRLTINIDKNLGRHIYVNGELNMNLSPVSGYNKLHTRELNLLTITPRWETMGLGAYLPVQYNAQGQLWVGAAVKLGPLVLGFHNLGLLRKDPAVNGGGYLLLSVHPFSKNKISSKLACME